MTAKPATVCSEERMQTIISLVERDTEDGVNAIQQALIEFPEDPRLHFLRGSLLIELRRFVEAHAALTRSVELAPEFHIARFQLGFFELTSGEAEAAQASWRPLLETLPSDHFLAIFIKALQALIADRFGDCVDTLREGIARNTENPALNRDMALLIEKCDELLQQQPRPAATEAHTDISATSFLLGTGRR